MNTSIQPPAGAIKTEGHAPRMQLFQFCGLLWATEYNAREAGLDRGYNAQHVNAMNTLLTAYGALEALVQETALVVHPRLYADEKGFRKKGLVTKYAAYLAKDGRSGERLPDVIAEISNHRIALTHSEPDNGRTFEISKAASATKAAEYAREVRRTADWLWGGRRPAAVAAGFDAPNAFMQ